MMRAVRPGLKRGMRCRLEAKLVCRSREAQHGFDVALDVEIVDLGARAVPMLGGTRAERQSRDDGGLRDAVLRRRRIAGRSRTAAAAAADGATFRRAASMSPGHNELPQHGHVARDRVRELARWLRLG